MKKETIIVKSCDFDGCLFNKPYVDEIQKLFDDQSSSVGSHAYLSLGERHRIMCEENVDFIQYITNDLLRSGCVQAYCMVGSLRQCIANDRQNARRLNKGSAFPALSAFAEKCAEILLAKESTVLIEVDPYLLADSYCDKESGTTYKLEEAKEWEVDQNQCTGKNLQDAQDIADQALNDEEDQTGFFIDASKLAILYAQMHKIATDHPEAKILFDFYDDLGPSSGQYDLATPLVDIFTRYPVLVPPNVTLHIYEYAGSVRDIKRVSPNGGLTGKNSEIDANYGHNIKVLTNLVLTGYVRFPVDDRFNIINQLKWRSKIVDQFIAHRVPGTSNPVLVGNFLSNLAQTLQEDFSREGIGWFFKRKTPTHIVHLKNKIKMLDNNLSDDCKITLAKELIKVLITAKDKCAVLRSGRTGQLYREQLFIGLAALGQFEGQFRERTSYDNTPSFCFC